MLTFTKNENTKFIDENSSLINVLKADGWVCDDLDDDVLPENIIALREEAKALGIKGAHLIKDEEKLINKIEDAKNKD